METLFTNRLLDPNRLVAIKRILRYPENEVTLETMSYWLALMIVSGAIYEQNTRSIRVLELEDAQCTNTIPVTMN